MRKRKKAKVECTRAREEPPPRSTFEEWANQPRRESPAGAVKLFESICGTQLHHHHIVFLEVWLLINSDSQTGVTYLERQVWFIKSVCFCYL